MIPFQRPSLPPTAEIDRYLARSREERWFSNGGPCWHLLRERLEDRVGAHCVPVASGTHGLMAALAALPPGPGDGARALMPSFTFIATAQATLWAGFEPILLDVAPDHWHLDPRALEEAFEAGPLPAVVLAVSAFGTPPPAATRRRWEEVCEQAGVPLVVDSAAGFGAVAEDGVAIGAQGDVEVVSFHATKPFAIGEGGAVLTRDPDLRDRVERAVNFGFGEGRRIEVPRGLNAKMSELHAATALAVLDRFDPILARRREAAAAVRAKAGERLSWQLGCERSTWQFLPVALPGPEERRRLIEGAPEIEMRVYYEPLHVLAPRRWAVAGSLSRTDDLFGRIACLPMANDLEPAELEAIAAALEGA